MNIASLVTGWSHWYPCHCLKLKMTVTLEVPCVLKPQAGNGEFWTVLAVISEFPTETLSTKSLFAPASWPTSEHFMSVHLRTAMPELSLLDAPASTLNKAGYHSA